MSAKFICDGCGKEACALINPIGDPIKPSEWFTLFDEKTGRQDACSRPCIEAIAKAKGVTRKVAIPS